ncbi:MAG: signal peptide peptidase SppA [Sphingobacteriales bacterium]
MRSFLKMFLASFVAIIVFFGLLLVLFFGIVGVMVASEETTIESNSVLFLDLSKNFLDKKQENPILQIIGKQDEEVPALFELTRLIERAKNDSSIKGIFIKAEQNANGFAASQELRKALQDFRLSKKFVIAYGEYISQKAYQVVNVADKIYVNPKGIVEWSGFSVEYVFFKNLLDRLEIKPQIFYDGKFKSATEPFRETQMTEANRLQTETWLGDLYARFLADVATARKLDSAQLRQYANTFAIRTPQQAVAFKLVDGVRYDDEVKSEMKKLLKLADDDKINFVSPGAYLNSKSLKEFGKDKIAVIYAEGEIIDGKGQDGQIGSDTYRNLIRQIRYDDQIKAIVLRVNSPGGSSLASEVIWRELSLARKSGKPVVVSMGDVAASGGYYISCSADKIFAMPNTITGSIGVFSLIPNMQDFFRNKLGVTFDGVETGPYADALTISKPLTEQEKQIIQNQVDVIYGDFKTRVGDARKMTPEKVEEVAQGRVWTGQRALSLGLVDELGDINAAIAAAAKLAKLKEYNLYEYPEPKSPFDDLFGSYINNVKVKSIEEEMGATNYKLWKEVKSIRDHSGKVQARLPFTFSTN